jgi:hypothetical protein
MGAKTNQKEKCKNQKLNGDKYSGNQPAVNKKTTAGS